MINTKGSALLSLSISVQGVNRLQTFGGKSRRTCRRSKLWTTWRLPSPKSTTINIVIMTCWHVWLRWWVFYYRSQITSTLSRGCKKHFHLQASKWLRKIVKKWHTSSLRKDLSTRSLDSRELLSYSFLFLVSSLWQYDIETKRTGKTKTYHKNYRVNPTLVTLSRDSNSVRENLMHVVGPTAVIVALRTESSRNIAISPKKSVDL